MFITEEECLVGVGSSRSLGSPPTMGLHVTIPPGSMGVEIRNLDVRTVGDAEIATIKKHLYERKLVVIRNQSPSDHEYIEFARRLGSPQVYLQPNYHHPEHPEIFVSSNEKYQGSKFGVRATGRYWHTDYSFMPEPLPLTMLRPKTLPRGRRETYYVDMAALLEELPGDLRAAISGRRGIHEGKYRYKVQVGDIDVSIAELLETATALIPPVLHPCIIEHPVTGVKNLYVNRGFTTGIDGLPYEEAQEVLHRIFEVAERSERIYTHTWQEGDILLWDNRSLMHRAGSVEPGATSTTYRIGIYDGLPFYVGLAPTKTQPLLNSGSLTSAAASGDKVTVVAKAAREKRPSHVEPVAPRRLEPVPESLVSLVLKPYQNKGCVYLQQASIEIDEGAPSWLRGGHRMRAQFKIPESCYINDTGHFNAVELCICFNQIAYLLGASLAQRGLFPGSKHLDEFTQHQLPGMLIKDSSSRYDRAINARAFEGEFWFESVEEKTTHWRMEAICRFWDEAGGKAEGTATLAVLKHKYLSRGTAQQKS